MRFPGKGLQMVERLGDIDLLLSLTASGCGHREDGELSAASTQSGGPKPASAAPDHPRLGIECACVRQLAPACVRVQMRTYARTHEHICTRTSSAHAHMQCGTAQHAARTAACNAQHIKTQTC